jgi:hypothetical protein
VIDFDHIENNDWLAVNQFTVVENKHSRRPDIVLENLLGETIARADVSIRYAPADPDLACELELRNGAPLMLLERVSYNADGVPLEHSLYCARAEVYEFSLTVALIGRPRSLFARNVPRATHSTAAGSLALALASAWRIRASSRSSSRSIRRRASSVKRFSA